MKRKEAIGSLMAIGAFAYWGFLPIYWKILGSVGAMELLANRMLWSFLTMALVVLLLRKGDEVRELLKNPRDLWNLFGSSIAIAANWGLFIWAINDGRILETSFGYFINPLLAVLLGVVVFKERMDRWTRVAIGLAVVGVLIKAIHYGAIPWISLLLAISFAVYGVLKKRVQASAMVGLAMETAFLAPVALVYLLFLQGNGQGAYQGGNPLYITMLVASGLVTAIPLLLFAGGAKRVSLSVLGFAQYISPTITLFLGTLVYGESVDAIDLLGFGVIWIALAIYSINQIRNNHGSQPGIEDLS